MCGRFTLRTPMTVLIEQFQLGLEAARQLALFEPRQPRSSFTRGVTQRLRARPFYFHYVTVNPKNENEVWVNELGLHKSTDGGKTFTPVDTPHGDNHGMWFNPDNPNVILQVNDGGGNVSQMVLNRLSRKRGFAKRSVVAVFEGADAAGKGGVPGGPHVQAERNASRPR